MQNCPHCHSAQIKKKNFYFVQHSNSKIRRYKCFQCKKYFSSKTNSPTYYQKKPFLNKLIFNLLMSGNTQRRTARLLHCSKNTVAQKLLWLALHKVESLILESDFKHIQIDELETIEHTKLKPITIPICVNDRYKILGLSVGKIRAKGNLAEISFKKYGPRENERPRALTELFEELKKKYKRDPITITTDAHPMYPELVKKYFPRSRHIQVVSKNHIKKKRELVYSAERKKLFDPIFALNQRFAMFRADVRRLTRRSWCTTKKIINLRYHLELYKEYNNNHLPT